MFNVISQQTSLMTTNFQSLLVHEPAIVVNVLLIFFFIPALILRKVLFHTVCCFLLNIIVTYFYSPTKLLKCASLYACLPAELYNLF